MAAADTKYWVRTEQGRVWGPYTLGALERVQGHFTEKCDVSTDGRQFRPGAEFSELRALLSPARVVEKTERATPRAEPTRASREVENAVRAQAAQRTESQGNTPRVIPRLAPAPPPTAPTELPESGDFALCSPLRLYALAALGSASGWLQLEFDGHLLQVSFRRGTPEHVSSDDPALSLARWLHDSGAVTAEQAQAAEAAAQRSGKDVVSVLFEMQLLPPADAARVLGDYALFLLDRAFVAFQGKFVFERDAPPPPGSFPLGDRWSILAQAIRRLEVVPLRARLGTRLQHPVVRSGGLAVGRVEQLALTAQETRLYASIDGTRTGEALVQGAEGAAGLRLLFLLSELGHVSFAEGDEPVAQAAPPRAPAAAPTPAVATPPPAPAPPAAAQPAPVSSAPPSAAARATPGPAPRPTTGPIPQSRPPTGPIHVARPPTGPIPGGKATTGPIPGGKVVTGPIRTTPLPPPPTFADGPEDEPAEQMAARLGKLLERLDGADHFEVLGVNRATATASEVRRNFFVLARVLHPDTASDPSMGEVRAIKQQLFSRVNEAAQALGDDASRKKYEEELDGKASAVDVQRIFAAEEKFQKAEILVRAHKYAEAQQLLEEAVELNADEAEFHALHGYAKFLQAKDKKAIFAEAAAEVKKAIKMLDVCVPAHLYLGNMAKIVGDLKLAQQCFRRVVALDDKNVDAQRELRLMASKK